MAVAKDSIEKIKAIPPSSVLEKEGATLKRVGREYVSHCLWHKDSNPSLTISDDKGFLFCHVCQQHTDAIGYVEKKNGLNFRQSCEKIASDFGINIQFDNEDSEAYRESKRKADSLLLKAQKTQEGYRDNLKKFPRVIEFLKSREILPETSRHFQLGYNSEEDRLTIPIKNYKGEIVGFSARALDNGVKPKYKNTETNLVFNKSNIIFNESDASQSIVELNECILVEGHLDVVMMHQAGCCNVVALQGTATPERSAVERLLRKTSRLVLCMDGDEGGRLAIGRFLSAIQVDALSGRAEVRIATLPEGMDPDDYIKSGNSIKDLIAEAASWLDWLLDSWLENLDFDSEIEFQDVEKKIIDLFSRLSSPALRAYYYDKASIRLAQNKQVLAAQIAKSFHENKTETKSSTEWRRPSPEATKKIAEKKLIRLYINQESVRFLLKPLMEKIESPLYKWLNQKIEEIEQFCEPELLKYSLGAALATADPSFVSSLRSVVFPTIKVEHDADTLIFIEDILIAGNL